MCALPSPPLLLSSSALHLCVNGSQEPKLYTDRKLCLCSPLGVGVQCDFCDFLISKSFVQPFSRVRSLLAPQRHSAGNVPGRQSRQFTLFLRLRSPWNKDGRSHTYSANPLLLFCSFPPLEEEGSESPPPPPPPPPLPPLPIIEINFPRRLERTGNGERAALLARSTSSTDARTDVGRSPLRFAYLFPLRSSPARSPARHTPLPASSSSCTYECECAP